LVNKLADDSTVGVFQCPSFLLIGESFRHFLKSRFVLPKGESRFLVNGPY
jgi:hypothetical protein